MSAIDHHLKLGRWINTIKLSQVKVSCQPKRAKTQSVTVIWKVSRCKTHELITTMEWIKSLKWEKAMELLKWSDISTTEVFKNCAWHSIQLIETCIWNYKNAIKPLIAWITAIDSSWRVKMPGMKCIGISHGTFNRIQYLFRICNRQQQKPFVKNAFRLLKNFLHRFNQDSL